MEYLAWDYDPEVGNWVGVQGSITYGICLIDRSWVSYVIIINEAPISGYLSFELKVEPGFGLTCNVGLKSNCRFNSFPLAKKICEEHFLYLKSNDGSCNHREITHERN